MAKKFTKEVLEAAVKESVTWGEVAVKIGASVHGGARDHLKKRCVREGIDFSHFLGSGWSKGKKLPYSNNTKRTAKDIFVIRANGKYRQHAHLLRRALIESGVVERCALCGIEKEWNRLPIVLEIDHMDGSYENCLRENLRFLCPNCHSQTKTYKTYQRQWDNGRMVLQHS